MSKRASYAVIVGGRDITTTLSPILTALTVSLRASDEGDSASIALDDTEGLIDMPKMDVAIQVALGWSGTGPRIVFEGTVDEVVSTGSRSGGRTLSISAKGFNGNGKVKERQRRHWDNQTVETVLKDAASTAGVKSVRVDPALAAIRLAYWAMDGESLLHMGKRLARRIGGDFQIQGSVAQMARRGASYAPTITAARGENLHAWNLSPTLGRAIYGKIAAPFFDQRAGRWDKVEVETGLVGDAVLTVSPPANDRADARRQAEAKAEACKRALGGGQVTIEGTIDAIPDGSCTVVGARPGIDRGYRILGVMHMLSRSGGWVTQLELGHPDQTSST